MSNSAILWTVAHQPPLSIGFSSHKYWSGLPCPPPGDLPNPGIELKSLRSPALVGGLFFFFLPLVQPGKAKAGLVVLNSLDFCLSEKPLISPSNLSESLTG